MGGAMDLVSSQAPRSPFVDSLKALSWNSCERHEVQDAIAAYIIANIFV